MDLTTYWSGFYRISPRINLSYDVVLFSEVLQQSAIAPVDEVEALLSRAATLYQGDFLSAMDNGWVHNRRSELSQSYGEALASLAKTREDEGQFEHALGLYLRAVAHNRQREDLIGSIMGLYRQMNMHADALHVFGRFERELRSELGVEPAPHLQDLARSIRDDQARLS
jgi:DNA-binding SARP family transcriptional activator